MWMIFAWAFAAPGEVDVDFVTMPVGCAPFAYAYADTRAKLRGGTGTCEDPGIVVDAGPIVEVEPGLFRRIFGVCADDTVPLEVDVECSVEYDGVEAFWTTIRIWETE